MNDIQNSNNYSNIITLPSSALATLPYIWPCKSGCIKCVCTPLVGLSLHLHIQERKAASVRQPMQSTGQQRGGVVCVYALVVHTHYLSREVSEEVRPKHCR